MNYESLISTPIFLKIFLGFVFVLVLFLFISIILKRKRGRLFLQRGMGLSLFLVSVPQESRKEQEKSQPIEDYLRIAEQFYTGLTGFRERSKLKRWFLGNPVLVFETAVRRLGEEIYFYVACPRSLAGMLEKQILSFWPKASVQSSKDYNIFNPQGNAVGSEAMLERSAVLPIKTYQELKVDPLSSISSVLTKLAKDGEGAAVQVLVSLSKNSLSKKADKVIQALQKGAKLSSALAGSEFEVFSKAQDLFLGSVKKSEDNFKKPDLMSVQQLSPINQEVIQGITRKASQPIFDVNLRLAASAETRERANMILQELQSAFSQFNTSFSNRLKFKSPKTRQTKRFFYQFCFRIFNEQKIMRLSSTELAGIFHFPLSEILTPHLKWVKAKQAPPPENLPETGLLLGKSVFRGEERLVRILQDDRRRHLYIIGQTGTGKSTFMRELIRQDMEQGEGLCLIDPHGDFAEQLLGLVPAFRAEDVIYFNPTDPEKAVGLNMLEFNPAYPESRTLVVNELLEIFEKLYNLQVHGFGGPIFEQYMRNSLLLVMEHPESGNTLIEVPRVLSDTGFRKFKLANCKNIVVKNFWEKEAEKAGGEASLANMVPYITSKMNIFIANDMVRPIIAQAKSAFDFRKVIDEGKILIINLSKGQLGDINSYLLGMIVVGKLLIAALSRADVQETQRRDFHLYIDEFHNVTTKTIASGLAEARKYRLSLILAHQYIGQLDEQTQKAVFGNVGSMMTFRVGPDDAKYLITQYAPVFDEQDLVNLDNYNSALRLLINGETSKPFNIMSIPPKPSDPDLAKIIKDLSRAKFGRSRAMVEAELAERLKTVF